MGSRVETFEEVGSMSVLTLNLRNIATVKILNIPDVPEKCIKTSTNEDSKTTTPDSCLVVFNQDNTTKAYNKTFKKATKHSQRRKKKLEIETEFKTLQSLIPKIANKPSINELEIIDACVNYIEALQEQLNIRSPDDSNLDNAQNKKPMSTSIQSIMSAIAGEQAENKTCLYSIKNTETDEYGVSESSDDDFSEEEVDDDKNNNNESPRKEHCSSEERRGDDSNLTVDCSMEDELSPTKMTNFL